METIFFIDRFLDVELELETLDYHLKLLEKQIKNIQAYERLSLQKRSNKLGISPDDPDWQTAQDAFDYTIDYFVPRIFRYPFLISLYAIYELAVTEAAKLLKERKGVNLFIYDMKVKGGFLNKAKKYFKDILDFSLCPEDREWERINILVKIRNGIAHANGRIEMMNKKTKESIERWERENIGISSMEGYIVLEERFLKDTFSLVKESLNDLIKRYRSL